MGISGQMICLKIRRIQASILALLPLLLAHEFTRAEMRILDLKNGSALGAAFPCVSEFKTVNSAVGVVEAFTCANSISDTNCIFLASAQLIDKSEYKKNGMRFVAEVHKQYATQMDANYKEIYQRNSNLGDNKNVLKYGLVRTQDGVKILVEGFWAVVGDKLVRVTASCMPANENTQATVKAKFLTSISIIN